MLQVTKDVPEAKPPISNPLTTLVFLFLILLSSGSKFSAKSLRRKQISNRTGPSETKAIVFSGSRMDTNINRPFKKLPLPTHGRLEK